MSEPTRFRIGPWTVLPTQNLLEADAQSVRLEPRAMDVLVVLAEAAGAVVSVDSLMATVWKDVVVGEGSVYLAIRQLRQALGGGRGTQYIETIPRRGYRMAVPVERLAAEVLPAPAVPAPAVPAPVGARRRPARWIAVAALIGAAAVGAAAVTVGRPARPPVTPSVAVLPFDNLSPDPEQDFFADGITVETLHALSRVRDLRVTSPTASFGLEERVGDLRSVGETLGVKHVLQGTVRTAGDRVRVTAQLSLARTGDRLWSETFERARDDVFLIQDDIARAVANALQVRLGVGDVGRVPGMTRNVAAYEEYLRAQARNLDWRPESMSLAVGHLQRAIALDPTFAMAWARLSTVYQNGMFVVPEREEEWRRKAAEALAHARALTPDAPDVLLEAGIMEARGKNWVAAAHAFQQLQAAYARHGVADRASAPQGVLLLAVGRAREAIPALERARAEDPLAPALAGFLSDAYLADGNLKAALAEIERGLRLEGLDALLLGSAFTAALNLRELQTIRTRLAAVPTDAASARVGRRLMPFIDGRPGVAAAIRRQAVSAGAAQQALLAEWAAFYGESELALQLLTDAVPRLSHPALVWQPLFADVRQLPGFRDLARTLGFVDYWRVHGWSDFCRPAAADEFICR